MAVEIKELVIRAIIAPADGEQVAAHAPAGPGTTGSPDPQALIQACVEQVLRILKKEKNR